MIQKIIILFQTPHAPPIAWLLSPRFFMKILGSNEVWSPPFILIPMISEFWMWPIRTYAEPAPVRFHKFLQKQGRLKLLGWSCRPLRVRLTGLRYASLHPMSLVLILFALFQKTLPRTASIKP